MCCLICFQLEIGDESFLIVDSCIVFFCPKSERCPKIKKVNSGFGSNEISKKSLVGKAKRLLGLSKSQLVSPSKLFFLSQSNGPIFGKSRDLKKKSQDKKL